MRQGQDYFVKPYGTTISLCLATLIHFLKKDYEISGDTVFLFFVLKNLIHIIKHNGKVNFQ